jgi:hypothetical protein
MAEVRVEPYTVSSYSFQLFSYNSLECVFDVGSSKE